MVITKVYPVGKFNIVQIIGTIGGSPTAKCLAPGSDISNETQEVKDVCSEAWTPEIIEAYEAHKAAQI